jgi:hypothetical protein
LVKLGSEPDLPKNVVVEITILKIPSLVLNYVRFNPRSLDPTTLADLPSAAVNLFLAHDDFGVSDEDEALTFLCEW